MGQIRLALLAGAVAILGGAVGAAGMWMILLYTSKWWTPEGVSTIAAVLQALAAVVTLLVTVSLVALTRRSVEDTKRMADYQSEQIRPRLMGRLEHSEYSTGGLLFRVSNLGAQPALDCRVALEMAGVHANHHVGRLKPQEDVVFFMPGETREDSHQNVEDRAAANHILIFTLTYFDGLRRQLTESDFLSVAEFDRESETRATWMARLTKDQEMVMSLRSIAQAITSVRQSLKDALR